MKTIVLGYEPENKNGILETERYKNVRFKPIFDSIKPVTIIEKLEKLRPTITEHLSGKSNIQMEEILLFQKQGEIRMLNKILEVLKKELLIANSEK